MNLETNTAASTVGTFFDINGTPYHMIRELDNAEQISVDFFMGVNNPLRKIVRPSKLLYLDIWHNSPGQLDRPMQLLADPDLYVITNALDPNVQHDRLIYVDFLFNRTKAYYSQFPWRPDTEVWYWHGVPGFQDFRLGPAHDKSHIFISPSKTYMKSGMRFYRRQLVDLLISLDTLGYIGNYDDDANRFLYAHAEFPWPGFSLQDLQQQTRPMVYNWWGYCPPHNLYYQDTFVSIYTESIETGTTLAVTEKTYDPLIKGHFILPFAAAHFMQHLRDIGVLLPDFIDYGYDVIEDDDKRFARYLEEVQRVLAIPLDRWKDLWNENLDLLYQNKIWFQDRPYDRIDLRRLLES